MKTVSHIVLLLLISVTVCAQTKSGQPFKGQITDAKNIPLENVYIYNSSTGKHTHSNSNGMFILQDNFIGNTVHIGLLGYKKLEFLLDKDHFNKVVTIPLTPKSIELEELIIEQVPNPLQSVTKIDLQTNPVNSSQEILRKVPGLIIGQHAGGGKAEQIFLRGFDVDHGTDVRISVDGMPVNMVSHAHGQGYSDLHFIIPETIQKINYGKGPYTANQGDFNTAGYVDFSTKKSLDQSQVSVTYGNFNSLRTLGMFNLMQPQSNENAYIAFEYIENDGPFESPQNFNRTNIFGKYTTTLSNFDKVTLTASHFTSSWDASGQIPQREVDNGNITRFGAIDDTEGGKTSRSNVNLEYFKNLQENTVVQSNVFYTKYNFELFSNFTFFLEDPINGDQIKQQENREIYGFNSVIKNTKNYADSHINYHAGLGIRYDKINNIALSKTKNRSEILEKVQLGNIKQTNMYAFFNTEIDFEKLTINPSLRLDYFKFLYNDQLQPEYTVLSKNKAILNPKLNITYTMHSDLQFFIKSGIGFHSNDARVILQDNTKKMLPRAYGVDIGSIWKPTKNIILNSALWYLFSEEEMVYVGDAGVVEPSGKSRRYGIDLGIRYQIAKWLYINTDATYTNARSVEDKTGENYIPLAPDVTVTGGLYVTNLGAFSGGFNFRYIDNRPANEDNSIVAKGYFVNDFSINYHRKQVSFGVSIDNIFDVAWNETQFATTSRLQNEPAPITEIHFTPGTPFFAKATVTYRF
ncbi:TonB-dependent receptor [Tenacibaculum sp. TC6]|uniref:TonB-dependent receptor n=1 Tax=Tenacibaculum sp. TC6 TaxID=3423223 RepID=UPI003D36306E